MAREAFLFDRMTKLEGNDGLSDWIRMFVKKPFESMAEAEKADIITQATARLKADLCKDGVWYADYVRLRMRAVKPTK